MISGVSILTSMIVLGSEDMSQEWRKVSGSENRIKRGTMDQKR